MSFKKGAPMLRLIVGTIIVVVFLFDLTLAMSGQPALGILSQSLAPPFVGIIVYDCESQLVSFGTVTLQAHSGGSSSVSASISNGGAAFPNINPGTYDVYVSPYNLAGRNAGTITFSSDETYDVNVCGGAASISTQTAVATATRTTATITQTSGTQTTVITTTSTSTTRREYGTYTDPNTGEECTAYYDTTGLLVTTECRPPFPIVDAQPSEVTLGKYVTISGSGFTPNRAVYLTFTRTSDYGSWYGQSGAAKIQLDSKGSFSGMLVMTVQDPQCPFPCSIMVGAIDDSASPKGAHTAFTIIYGASMTTIVFQSSTYTAVVQPTPTTTTTNSQTTNTQTTTSKACGGNNEPPCLGNECDEGYYSGGGLCVPIPNYHPPGSCGRDGQPSCGGRCNDGYVYVDDVCYAPSHVPTTCGAGYTWNGVSCVYVGGGGGGGGSCPAGWYWDGTKCEYAWPKCPPELPVWNGHSCQMSTVKISSIGLLSVFIAMPLVNVAVDPLVLIGLLFGLALMLSVLPVVLYRKPR